MKSNKKNHLLARMLADKVGSVTLVHPETTPADYEDAFSNAARSARLLREQVQRNRERFRTVYSDFVDQPPGRQATLLQNSSPITLAVFAFELMHRSFELRVDDPPRSLALATLARHATAALEGSSYFSDADYADLKGECLCHLANAKRITADLPGAESDLREAEAVLQDGTHGRDLRANFLSFLASLRITQRRSEEAAELYDKEIALRRLLGDPDRLATALIDSGVCQCLSGSDLAAAGEIMKEAIELTSDNSSVFVALYALAEAWARQGDGLAAWRLICTGDLVSVISGPTPRLPRRRREWIRGLTYRCLGEFDLATSTLREVREEFIEHGQPLFAAFASLDLMAALAAQKRSADIVELADWVYRTFKAEGLDNDAIFVYLSAHEAALDRSLTEALAVRVSNFLLLQQHSRNALFR